MVILKMISVIIPTYNRKNLLEKGLSSLLNQNYPKNKYEIVIVDDASTDDTQNFVKYMMKNNKNIKYIRHKTNKGVAVARNTGIKNSGGGIIVSLDDDSIPKINFLKNINETFRKNKDIFCIAGRINSPYNNIFTKAIQLDLSVGYKQKKDRLYTGNLSLRRTIFKKVGYFDKRFLRCGDVDLNLRVKKYYRIYYSDNIIVAHLHKYKLKDFFYYHKNIGKYLFILDKKNNGLSFFNYLKFFWGGIYDSINNTFPHNIRLFPAYLFGILITRFFYYYKALGSLL